MTGDGKHSTFADGDDFGMACDIGFTTLSLFPHSHPHRKVDMQ